MHQRFFTRIILLLCLVLGSTSPVWAEDDWRALLSQMPTPLSVPVGKCQGPPEALPSPPPQSLKWGHPTPQGDNLLGVWGSTPKQVWAVGDMGRILRYDGKHWRVADSAVKDYLAGVWADPSGEAFITGYNGRVLHFDGQKWWNHPTGVSNDFNGIWGSGPDDVFTVGDRGVIFHYDGHCWKRQESHTHNLFFGVWGSGPTDVWAVGGRGNVSHYDGTDWQAVNVGHQAHFVGVWGSGPDNVYLVGNDGLLLNRQGDGPWRAIPLQTDALLRWIWGDGPNDVWVAGDAGIIRHFDGNTWQTHDLPGGQAIRGGWQDPQGNVTVVGDDGLLMRGTRAGLKAVRNGTRADFSDLAATSGDWAVGTNGTALQRDRKGVWRDHSLPTGQMINSVATLADGRVLASAGFALWLYNGTAWEGLSNPGSAPIVAMTAWGEQAVAVGREGVVIRFDGTAWHALQRAGSGTLYGIGGHSADEFWVVGQGGTALRMEEGQWASHPLPDQPDLTAITASGIAVDTQGNVHQWRHGRWYSNLSNGRLSLYAAIDDPTGGAWAVGDFGTIIRIHNTEDDRLIITPIGGVTGQSLWGVGRGPRGRIHIVGDGGTILERPGHRRWWRFGNGK